MPPLESEKLEVFLSKLPPSENSKIFKRLVKALFSSPASSYFFSSYAAILDRRSPIEIIMIMSSGFNISGDEKDPFSIKGIFIRYVLSKFMANHDKMQSRLQNDLQILSSLREQSVYKDDFGELKLEKWASILRRYLDEKVSPILAPYIEKNHRSLISLGDVIGVNFNLMGYGLFSEGMGCGASASEKISRDIVLWAAPAMFEYLLSAKEEGGDREEKNIKSNGQLEMLAVVEDLGGYIRSNLRPSPTGGDDDSYSRYLLEKIGRETSLNAHLVQAAGGLGGCMIIEGKGVSAVVKIKHSNRLVDAGLVHEALEVKDFYKAGIAVAITNEGFEDSAFFVAKNGGVLAFTEEKFMIFLSSL